MGSPLSVDDLFTVGVGLDLVGGYFLGRGLLVQPIEIKRRSSAVIGHNPATMAGLIGSRADAEVGVAGLVAGFSIQACGYLAEIGGTRVATGAERTWVAVLLLAAVIAAVLLLARKVRARRVNHWACLVAKTQEDDQGRYLPDLDYPDGTELVHLAHALGYEPFKGDGDSAADISEYAHKFFGVDRVHLPGGE